MSEPCTPAELEQLANYIATNASSEMKPEFVDLAPSYEVPETTGEAQRLHAVGIHQRIARVALGDDWSAGPHNELTRALTVRNNAMSAIVPEANEAIFKATAPGNFLGDQLNRFRNVPLDLDSQTMKGLTLLDKDGKVGDPTAWAQLPPKAQELAQSLNDIAWKAYNKHVVGNELLEQTVPTPYVHMQYEGLINDKPHRALFWATDPKAQTTSEALYIKNLLPDHIKWFRDSEMTGGAPQNVEKRGTVAFDTYVRSLVKKTIVEPVLNKIESNFINPKYGVFVYKRPEGGYRIGTNDNVAYMYWKDLRHHVMGGAAAGDTRMTALLKDALGTVGIQTDSRGLYFASNMMSNFFYAGAMAGPGGRPSSIFRQLFQSLNTWAELGTRPTFQGFSEALNDIWTGGALRAKYESQGLLTSYADNLVHSMDTAQQAGRQISQLVDSGLKLFGFTDKLLRIGTARSAEINFDRAMAEGGIEKLQARKAVRDELTKLVAKGKLEDAKSLYIMDTVNNTQFGYGIGNKPEWARGAIGSLMSIFMSYPMNSWEMVAMFAKRALRDRETGEKNLKGLFQGKNDAMPLIRLMAGTSLAMYMGSEMLNADLRQAMFFTAIPHSLVIPKTGADLWSAGAATNEWITSKLYNVGMSNMAKKQQADAYSKASRDLLMFAPGYQFVNDMRKLYDGGSMAQMLGLTPKAEVLNEFAKQQAIKRRMEKNQPGLLQSFIQ